MNCFMSLASIFLILLPLAESSFRPLDANLIEQTCKQTPLHDLCVSTLKSDPRSSSADTAGLGRIVIDKVQAKATQTLNTINGLRKQKPELKAPLSSCVGYYDTILKANVPQAIEAFEKGNPKFAQQGAQDAANEANSCEESFHGKSPITALNKATQDLSVVAAAIAQILL